MKRNDEMEAKMENEAAMQEKKEAPEEAGLGLNDDDLDRVSGGYGPGGDGPWQQCAKGSYVNFGQYIVYTVVGGDVMSGIAIRFGVTVREICMWNNIKNPDLIYIHQKLTIYPTILR